MCKLSFLGECWRSLGWDILPVTMVTCTAKSSYSQCLIQPIYWKHCSCSSIQAHFTQFYTSTIYWLKCVWSRSDGTWCCSLKSGFSESSTTVCIWSHRLTCSFNGLIFGLNLWCCLAKELEKYVNVKSVFGSSAI